MHAQKCLDNDATTNRSDLLGQAFVKEPGLTTLGSASQMLVAAGRSADHPGTLLEIHLYAKPNRISSSGRLARETQRKSSRSRWLLKWLLADLSGKRFTLPWQVESWAMRGREDRSEILFNPVRLEERVQANHPLPRISFGAKEQTFPGSEFRDLAGCRLIERLQ